MSSIYIAAITILLTTLPYHLLTYYPFRDRLRFPSWAIMGVVGAIQVLQLLIICFLVFQGYEHRLAEFLFTPLFIVVYLCCVTLEIPKLLLFYIFVTDYLLIIREAAVFLETVFFHTTHPSPSLSLPGALIHLGLLCATMPLVLVFLDRTKERVTRIHAPWLWKTLWIVPCLTSFVILLFTWDFRYNSSSLPFFLLAQCCLLLSMIILYHILICSLDTIRTQAEKDGQSRCSEQVAALQHSQYLLMQKRIEEAREARHSLRQHLKLVQAYLADGDTKGLKDYMDTYAQQLPSGNSKPLCNNYAVDLLVRYYAEMAEAAGIDFRVQLALPSTLSLDESDLCVLLGNLLENAVDACRQDAPAAPFIRLNARTAGERALSITLDNSCKNAPILENGRFLSTKHREPGTGMLSVCSIVSQYNGITDFKFENGIFYASVFLNPQSVTPSPPSHV